MKRRALWFAVVCGLALCVFSDAWADKKVAESELPQAVKDALKMYVPNWVFVSCELDEKRGKATYELNVKDGEDSVHLHVTETGKVKKLVRGYSFDDEIPPSELPQAVRDALNKIRPGAEILEVEVGRHHGRLIYEVEIRMGEAREEIDFSEKGDILKIEVEHDED